MTFPSDSRPDRPRDIARLADLPGGTAAIFEAARVPAPERELLAALGLRRGALLRVRCARGPCIVQVGSARVALAAAAARRILVRPLGGETERGTR
jgi:Fe2+ transport system protein FeoA